jgi:hypothetical protein
MYCYTAIEGHIVTQSEIYAGFFGLVHELLESDKRRSQSCTNHLIAPFYEGCLPIAQDFRQVRCQSLSLEGVDYFDDLPPTTERIILLLGAKRPIFLTASILKHARVPAKYGAEYLINCRFTSRISSDVLTPATVSQPAAS